MHKEGNVHSSKQRSEETNEESTIEKRGKSRDTKRG
jgi:hypothetical protein